MMGTRAISFSVVVVTLLTTAPPTGTVVAVSAIAGAIAGSVVITGMLFPIVETGAKDGTAVVSKGAGVAGRLSRSSTVPRMSVGTRVAVASGVAIPAASAVVPTLPRGLLSRMMLSTSGATAARTAVARSAPAP